MNLHQRLKVCVVDAHDTWLYSWKKHFEALDIEFLRSPALAHPDNLGKSLAGLWKLPSTQLFVDFCENLADSLSHDYIQGKVTGVAQNSSMSLETLFRVDIDNGRNAQHVSAKAAILATGPTGRSITPPPV
jgi:hypothetical protein